MNSRIRMRLWPTFRILFSDTKSIRILPIRLYVALNMTSHKAALGGPFE
jgi:hypothetical protein